ncbi:50S ribosomal protein L3 N(5)-glutamine methyltransferase [Chromatium okenii]|jgi:ribosomal protein L3 glutamine methyltransferase|uniref:Ribosomal protein uL3 glutamine methyltransferase n=1 Tax=Chromatium okenii TaxID=61644 RepID=A0A2S7XRZ7_9GAMM|nr:50S ribosomal protein L3 N(5)-glutamine methyltransferase [Chromatium okenii]MBV5309012.1 50S ribosomal protein L3 N(5)-glutamine methyltransferase [Chromatium okenii]PQJ96500.1 50S ribosomal protein L3 N(5)-glutamine methyltransferase [Chromatium okenii]
MAEQPDGLITIQDFVRWGASRFNAAKLSFGHGTDNAIDEATHLVLSALHLAPALPPGLRECRLTPAERVAVCELIERRIAERLPASYLSGRAWFAGLEFTVNQQVLIPRSPIAELVEAGFDPWIDSERITRVLDLCTGSGCIGIAAAIYLPDVDVDLVDISPAALEIAQHNVAQHHLTDRVQVLESDLFTALSEHHYDVIVSNPPYVSRAELDSLPAEYHNEPALGLFGGEDGLDLVMNILSVAADYLNDGGILIVEVGNSAPTLESRLPKVPFTWLEFERGGEGVFLLTRAQLLESQAQIDEALRA